jgi:hypothetical protein
MPFLCGACFVYRFISTSVHFFPHLSMRRVDSFIHPGNAAGTLPKHQMEAIKWLDRVSTLDARMASPQNPGEPRKAKRQPAFYQPKELNI